MSERIDVSESPFNPLDGALFAAGGPNREPSLTMRPADDRARFSLRIAKAHLEKAVAAFGRDIPPRIGEMTSTDEGFALCLGPDEWLLMAPENERNDIANRFAKMSREAIHSLVDVGHRNVGIEISGPAAALALNAGCPLDLEAMPNGGCTRTILDKVEIVLMKRGADQYRLEIVRSFAEFAWKFLATAGREFTVGSGPPDEQS